MRYAGHVFGGGPAACDSRGQSLVIAVAAGPKDRPALYMRAGLHASGLLGGGGGSRTLSLDDRATGGVWGPFGAEKDRIFASDPWVFLVRCPASYVDFVCTGPGRAGLGGRDS